MSLSPPLSSKEDVPTSSDEIQEACIPNSNNPHEAQDFRERSGRASALDASTLSVSLGLLQLIQRPSEFSQLATVYTGAGLWSNPHAYEDPLKPYKLANSFNKKTTKFPQNICIDPEPRSS